MCIQNKKFLIKIEIFKELTNGLKLIYQTRVQPTKLARTPAYTIDRISEMDGHVIMLDTVIS